MVDLVGSEYKESGRKRDRLEPTESLHVEAVADLRLLGRADVFHDVSDLPGTLQRDRKTTVHLSVVPVHLCQPQDLVAQTLER
jgi:hypothetical protein